MDEKDRSCLTVFDHPSCYATDPSGERIIFGPAGQPPASFTFEQKCDAHCASANFNTVVPIIACGPPGLLAREETDCTAHLTYEVSCGTAQNAIALPKRSCTNVDTIRDPPLPITLLEDESTALIRFRQADGGTDSVTVGVSGKLSIDRDRCSLASCDIALLPISLHLNDFEVSGERFRDVAIGLTAPVPGTLGPTGIVNIPQNGAMISVRGTLETDGVPRQEDFPLIAPLLGRVDHSTGRVTLSLLASSSAFRSSLDINLVGRLKERSPVANFTLAPTVECNTAGGSIIEVDARQSIHPDATGLEYVWSVDGLPAALGPQAQLFLPLGQHEVLLFVRTPGSLNDMMAKIVSVVDTLPPVFDFAAVTPSCIWPPNHSMAIFRLGTEILVTATDVCDRALRFELQDVEDSQARETRGAGQTSPDVRWNAEAVCLRQERSGLIPEAREYSIRVAAHSTTGPSATSVLAVQVPHDQRSSTCRHPARAVSVEDDELRCAPLPPRDSSVHAPAVLQSPVEGSAALGCSVTSGVQGAPTALLLLAALWWWPTRRRNSFLILLTTFVAACVEPPAPIPKGQLGECARGWWLGPSGSCTIVCPGAPECDAGDCERYSFLALLPDEVSLQGFLSQSKRNRTFSSFGNIDQNRWSADADGGRIRLTMSGMWVDSTCSDQSLSYSISDLTKAPADLTAALNASPRDGGWQARHY